MRDRSRIECRLRAPKWRSVDGPERYASVPGHRHSNARDGNRTSGHRPSFPGWDPDRAGTTLASLDRSGWECPKDGVWWDRCFWGCTRAAAVGRDNHAAAVAARPRFSTPVCPKPDRPHPESVLLGWWSLAEWPTHGH